MGFEIGIDNDFPWHPKTDELQSILGPEADCYPLRLWCWASKYARDGTIKVSPKVLEKQLRWTGKAGRLHAALVKVGFIDRNRKTIHDWKYGIGRQIILYEKKKEKQRERYALSVGILPEQFRRSSPNPGDPGNTGNPGGEYTPLVLDAMDKAGTPGKAERKLDCARAMAARLGSEAVRVMGLKENRGLSLFDLEDKYLRERGGRTVGVGTLKEHRKRGKGGGE